AAQGEGLCRTLRRDGKLHVAHPPGLVPAQAIGQAKGPLLIVDRQDHAVRLSLAEEQMFEPHARPSLVPEGRPTHRATGGPRPDRGIDHGPRYDFLGPRLRAFPTPGTGRRPVRTSMTGRVRPSVISS